MYQYFLIHVYILRAGQLNQTTIFVLILLGAVLLMNISHTILNVTEGGKTV